MKYFILVICTFLFGNIYAQQYECSTDAQFWERMKTDSAFRAQNELLEKAIQQSNAQRSLGFVDTVINIPVVIHIIHKGEAIGTGSNISDEQIYAGLEGVNDRFRGRWGFGPDSKIQFCLAKSDPNGRYTTGINRVRGSSVKNFDSLGMSIFNGGPAAFEHDVKDLSRWPSTQYYNIWVVWNIYGPTGFAYLPTTTVDNYDGCVITASGFNYNNSITTHELGHAFNLLHVWETNYTTCQSTANCDKVDDKVCDTPPHINMGNGDCTDIYPCTSNCDWDNTRYNYLGKCGSQNRFTPDQIDRMRACIPVTVRDSLTHSKACMPRHKNDLGITSLQTCGSDLKVVVKNFGANTVTQFSIGWSLDGKSQKVYNWNGTLTSESTASVVFSSNVLSAAAGVDLKIWPIKPNNVADTIYVNDTLVQLNQYLPLPGGVYTIGGTSPDYKTIDEATTDLNNRGICGAVVFNIRKGIYKEQCVINLIRGSSAINTVTFQSEGKNANLVEVVYDNPSITKNYIFQLNAASHINIKHLTLTSTANTYYSNVIQQINNASSNHIQFSVLNGNGATWSTSTANALIYSKNTIDSSNIISNNVFNGGSYGVYHAGSMLIGPGVIIDSNRFNNQTYNAIYVSFQKYPIISNNIITTVYSQFYAISIDNCQKESRVLNNRIYGKMKGGIRLNGCKSSEGHVGIIANNFVQTDGPRVNEGISIRDSDHQLIAHNSVYLKAIDTVSKSLNCYRSYSIEIFNNIFSNQGDGYAIYLDRLDLTGLIINYNDLYSTGKLGYFNFNLLTFQNWKSQTGFDANSVSVDPYFQTDSFLFPCQAQLNGAGKYLYQLNTDILGKNRNSSKPDIGAIEFDLETLDLGKDTSVCGSFTIDAIIPNAKYTWSTGDTTRTITVNTSGQYRVEVISSCGSWSDSIEIAILDQPTLNLGSDQSACDSVRLSATTNGKLLWNSGDTSKSITAVQTGYYVATATNKCGQISDSVLVTIWPKPSFSLGADTSACDRYNLTPKTNDYKWLWNTGDTTKTLEILTSWAYSAELRNSFGCVGKSDTIQINIYTSPNVFMGNDTTILESGSLLLKTKKVYSKYVWSDGSTASSLLLNGKDLDSVQTITVTVTDKHGCEGSDTIVVFREKLNGVNEFGNADAIRIYPNPAKDVLTIETKAEFNISNFVIIDFAGQTVLSANLKKGNDQIDVKGLAPGSYVIEVLDEHQKMYRLSFIKLY